MLKPVPHIVQYIKQGKAEQDDKGTYGNNVHAIRYQVTASRHIRYFIRGLYYLSAFITRYAGLRQAGYGAPRECWLSDNLLVNQKNFLVFFIRWLIHSTVLFLGFILVFGRIL